MVMLTTCCGLNVTVNYSRLHISMSKFSLDENIPNFTCKTKLTLLCETNNMPRTSTPSNLCFKSSKDFDAKKLGTSP